MEDNDRQYVEERDADMVHSVVSKTVVSKTEVTAVGRLCMGEGWFR